MQAAGKAGVRLDWLDYLRLVCALWVLFGHYLSTMVGTIVQPGVSGYGLAGEIGSYAPVALGTFLMMSGMVITMVAQRETGETFFAHRFARIYPTFFVLMTLAALMSTLGPERIHVGLVQYVANLPVNAPFFGQRFVVGVYWTLVVEICFYFAMLAVIMTGAIRRLQTVVACWLLLQAAAVALPWRVPLLHLDYYFLAAGAVFGLLYQGRNVRLNLALLAVSLLLCLRAIVHYGHAFAFDPVIGGIATILLFGFFLWMRGRNPKLPGARRIGSMTYPLYLLHFHLGAIIFFHWIDEDNKWWLVGATSLFVIAASFAFDHVVEFRLRRYWIALARRTVARPVGWIESRLALRSTRAVPVCSHTRPPNSVS